MSREQLDEQDLGRRVDGALAIITSGPAPAAAIVTRGRRIRQRRRAARAGVGVVAALVVAIPVYTAVRGRPPSPAGPAARHEDERAADARWH